MLSEKEFRNTVEEMIFRAATRLPKDVVKKLKDAKKQEEKTVAKQQLGNILENLKIAREEKKPLCQDTGIPIFFIKKSPNNSLNFDLEKTLTKIVKESTRNIPLRPNVVHPLTRENTGDNTGFEHPLFHLIPNENGFEVEILLKGGGSENWSKLHMLKPTSSEEQILKKIVELVKNAGGEFCPPGILGVGIGGTADFANYLAKKSLLTPLDKENNSKELASLEEKITKKVNNLGIGPMGLGGKTTVLGTRIEKAGSHTASLPLAINPQCWAARRAKASLKNGELKIEVPK